MPRLARTLAWAAAGCLVAAPLAAAIYTVSLKNGNAFETRYQPEDASWDSSRVVFLDEWGNFIAIAKDDIEKIESDVAAKGYGSVIDSTTMYLGWAPNDEAEAGQGGAGGGATPAPAGGGQPSVTYGQFVEPDQTQGMPAQWVGYPYNVGGNAPPPAAPPPPPSTPASPPEK